MTESAFRLASQEYDPAIPVESISEHPANPNEGATTVLDEMLAEHGFYGAIIIQKSTRFIIAGNHRHREAVKLGAETLPGFWLDVDDEQAAKMMAGDNESTRLASSMWARFRAVPVLRLSTQVTEQPSASSRSARCEPRNPAPPVITTF